MIKIKVLGNIIAFIVLLLSLLFCFFIDFDLVQNIGSSDFFLFLLINIFIYIFIQIRSNLFEFYRSLSPFFLYSIFFWWLPIYIIIIFFRGINISPLVYKFSIICYIEIILLYEFFSFFIPPMNKFQFTKIVFNAKSVFLKNRKFFYFFGKFNVMVSIIFTLLFLIKAGGIPFFAENPEVARVNAMKGSGVIHRISYLSLHFALITTVICLIFDGKKITPKYIVYVFLLVFFNMLMGPRSYALWGLLFFYITAQSLKYNRLKFRTGIKIGIFVLFIVAIVGGLRFSGIENFNTKDTIVRFINRIYMNPVNANRLINYFDDSRLTENSFFIDLKILLPGHQPDLGTYLKDKLGIRYDGGGITVPMISEGYINYGYIGVLMYTMIFVLLVKIYEIIIFSTKTSLFKLVFIILIPVQFMEMTTMGISGMLVKVTFPSIIVFFTVLVTSKIFFVLLIRK